MVVIDFSNLIDLWMVFQSSLLLIIKVFKNIYFVVSVWVKDNYEEIF